MAFERFSPRKSISALRCWRVGRGIALISAWVCPGRSAAVVAGEGGPLGPSSSGREMSGPGWKLFIEAQALTSVPSTENCLSDRSGATSRCARNEEGQQTVRGTVCPTNAITLRDISVVSSRSRFFVKTVGTQTWSSMPNPTKQRNSRLYYICSISCRSERTENRIWSRLARISRSGASRGGRNRCRALRTRHPGGQRHVHHQPDLAQRMACRNARPEINIAEQRPARLVSAAHHHPRLGPSTVNHVPRKRPRIDFFSGLLE